MDTIRNIVLTFMLMLVPACGMDVKLELGTMGLSTRLTVDDWAQANVLKALDELIAGEETPENPVLEENEVVQPQE